MAHVTIGTWSLSMRERHCFGSNGSGLEIQETEHSGLLWWAVREVQTNNCIQDVRTLHRYHPAALVSSLLQSLMGRPF